MPVPESKFKNKIVSCMGHNCPLKTKCQLWYNLNEKDVWEKLRTAYNEGAKDCMKFKPI